MAIYTTNFDATENPISEDGAWIHLGTSWTKIQTASGVASGLQGNAGNLDDSYAYLSGFPPDQNASAVISKGATSGTQEIELLLRWLDTASTARGYECLLAHDGTYVAINRWNGNLNDFEILYEVDDVTIPQNGDTFSASIVGNVITVQLNGVTLVSGDVTASPLAAATPNWTTGNPGMGFYRSAGSAMTTYCYTSFRADAMGPFAIPSCWQQARRNNALGNL